MNKIFYVILFFFMATAFLVKAQSGNGQQTGGSLSNPQPFLYTLNSLNPDARHWSLNYSGGYGQYTVTPLGFDGVTQNLSVRGYLGDRYSLISTIGLGFGTNGNTQSYQQAEVFKDFIGGREATGFRFGTSLGFIREFSSDIVALSRFNAAYETLSWKIAANGRFEHAFAAGRDAVDVITSFGIQRKIVGQLFGGVEAVGQDLEGLWEAEAEGGAKVLLGPSLSLAPLGSRLSFSLSAGPIFYVTRNAIIPNDSAIRDLPFNNGFTVKFNAGFNFL